MSPELPPRRPLIEPFPPGPQSMLTSPTVPPPVVPPPGAPVPMRPASAVGLLVPVLVGGLVATAIGVYGKLHEPTGLAVNLAGFSSPQTVKVWLATLAATLAVVQLFTALVMYDRLPVFRGASWLGPVHRWSGRLAFVTSLPVAMHCLYALGFASYDVRVLAHSLLGCFFYGVFTVKMLVLAKKGLPGWALPLFGGLVFTGLAGLFVSSSLWFFTTFGIRF